MAGNAADPTQRVLLGRDQSHSCLLRDLPWHPRLVLVTGTTETWTTLCGDGGGEKCLLREARVSLGTWCLLRVSCLRCSHSGKTQRDGGSWGLLLF